MVDEARDPDQDEILERIKTLESAGNVPGYRFQQMDDEEAREISGWRYEPPYDFYDADERRGRSGRATGSRARRKAPTSRSSTTEGSLVGFFQFENEGEAVDVGLDLRPDLTGEVSGSSIVLAGLEFARRRLLPGRFTLSVATFNERAIRSTSARASGGAPCTRTTQQRDSLFLCDGQGSVKLRRFSGLSFRNLRARVQRTLLTAVGIVLGVGIVFGVLTLSNTMSGTFKDLFTRAYGSSDLTVTAAGGSGGFDQKVVQKVRGYEGVGSAAPRYSFSSSLILEKEERPA